MADNTRQIVCGEKGKREGCGTVFTHVQEGRGRPPVYCPECAGKPYTAKVVKDEDALTFTKKVFLDRRPKVGDFIVRPSMDLNDFEYACYIATPCKVLRIEGNDAFVFHPEEKREMNTDIRLTNVVEWR